MQILELLRSVAPDVAARAKGVPLSTIQTIERELGISFPETYRSFLLGLGYDTGGFTPMGRTHTTDLRELLAELPGPEERISRYWRISIERDMYHPVATDLYLDLATSDGVDADVVGFQWPPEPGEDPHQDKTLSLSFFDKVRLALFSFYISVHSWASYTIFVRCDPPELTSIDDSVRAVMSSEGFSELIPYSNQLSLFYQADHSVEWWTKFTHPLLHVKATTREQAALLVEKLRDHIPAQTTVST